MSGDSREIVEEYLSSLVDLTINSKPQINMLTMLAEEYVDHAAAIVEAVEAHLQKVRSEVKLPVLYLIDSIVKNVSGAYLSLFTKNIVNTFSSVFEKVDENTRASMWKLRQTWNEVFPIKKLFALDVRVHNIDPAWPIAPLPASSVSANSIHVNPKFLSMQQQQAQQVPVPAPKIMQPPVVTPVSIAKMPANTPVAVKPAVTVSSSEAEMREQLLKKQRELIELQKQKIELELLQAKASLEQQRRQLDKQTTHLKTEAPNTIEGGLEKPLSTLIQPSPIIKPLEKQFPAAAATLMKTSPNKSTVKIVPASSVAVASVKNPASRDPRLKISFPEVASENTAVTDAEELTKQQIMHQFKLHMQSKISGEQNPSLNDIDQGTSVPEGVASNNNKSLDNKRAKESSQKKEPVTITASVTPSTNVISSQRNSSISKDQSKSSSTKSSSTRGSSSSYKTSSSSSRKTGSKSRSKMSASSSPCKVPKLEENSPSSSSSSTSSSPDKRLSSKNSKTRKTRSPSPPAMTANNNNMSYRIPRRVNAQESTTVNPNSNNINSKSAKSTELVEDDQLNTLTGLPPHPPQTNFKEIRSTTRQRNYIRRNKDGNMSPEIASVDKDSMQDVKMLDVSKDEDLRAPIVSVNVAAAGAAAAALDTKEDLDLRVLTVPTVKRQSPNLLESANAKKRRADKFDALFGNEDVDLRTLTNPKAGRPPTPPPPVISAEEPNKDNCWAKLKSPAKPDRDIPAKPLTDRNRDRLGRPRLYKSTDNAKDSRRLRGPPVNRDLDKHSERNADRNIEIIMKQAAEQLNQGSITKSQYNTLIQEVLHMSEDQKLKAAQLKEQEIGMLVWEKGIDVGSGVGQNFSGGNEENIRKEHPAMHPRGPPGIQGGPRWQGPWHQPWSHPPHGPFPPGGPHGPFSGHDGFRPMGPWQNHPRLFGGPMRPDFHPPFFAGFNPRLGPPPPIGPNGPIMMNNGPMNSMGVTGGLMNPMGPVVGMGQMPAGMMMGNGPIRAEMPPRRMSPNSVGVGINNNSNLVNSNPTVGNASGAFNSVSKLDEESTNVLIHVRELPSADPKLLEEINKDTMKSINIDNVPKEIRYYGNIGIVFMKWDDPRDIGFQDGSRRVFIDGKDSIVCNFNDDYREFTYEGEVHRIKLGTPTRELYVDDKWYECYFGGRPVIIDFGNKKVNISLEGPPPQVKIGLTKRTDLVLGKINLIINARNMVPVFLDAKPQVFEIENKSCTLEFTDALQTVLLNGRPFKVEFGGLPKPIIIQNKKHFIRFSVLPRGFRAGYVKITGMKGEEPKLETQQLTTVPSEDNSKTEAAVVTSQPTIITALPAPPSLPPGLDFDSNSQDEMDTIVGPKPDLQLDVLSSVVPSAMAPSSGLSYQAEPIENPPAPAPALSLPLNLTELFQRLVETGIVPNLAETKKSEEEEKKEPEIIPVSFDKPETLKTKQPTVISTLYSGMQCSSCGARFAPEMATRYSHHLDWHFRQNRKERDSARKAHSRSWYYDISDWIQFEEVEDLEDRAQSWFETEKQTAEAEGTTADDIPMEAQQPSVPTGPDEEPCCEVCHETFEQFYNEEKEEWHIRPTVVYEEKNYHPLCLEDHKEKLLVRALEKSAMVLEEAITEMEEETMKEEQKASEIKEEEKEEETIEVDVEIKDLIEKKPEIAKEEIENQVEVKEEPEAIKIEETKDSVDLDDSEPIEIIEPLPRKIELEEIDDSSEEEVNQTDAKSKNEVTKERKVSVKKRDEKIPDDVPLIFENVKIKQEPVDDEPEPEESIAEAAGVDTTQVEVKSSIDGNVELDSATPTIPSAQSKIKINITKSLNVIPKENIEEMKDKEKKPSEGSVETAPAKPLIPAAIKPALQGKKLSILPTVEKGHELSGLCSIM